MLTTRQINRIKSTIDGNATGFPLVFQALGDSGRFSIFKLLMNHHDICVTDIAKVFDITVSAASQQLRILERLGLVIKIRVGQMVCYEINRENSVTQRLIKLIKSH